MLDGGEYSRHLANAIKRPVRGDAAFCSVALTAHF